MCVCVCVCVCVCARRYSRAQVPLVGPPPGFGPVPHPAHHRGRPRGPRHHDVHRCQSLSGCELMSWRIACPVQSRSGLSISSVSSVSSSSSSSSFASLLPLLPLFFMLLVGRHDIDLKHDDCTTSLCLVGWSLHCQPTQPKTQTRGARLCNNYIEWMWCAIFEVPITLPRRCCCYHI